MAESVAPTAAEILSVPAKEYASLYFRYFFCYGKIVEDFTNKQKELELREKRVKALVDEAKKQNEIIHDDVKFWLATAEKELEEINNLKKEIDRAKCFNFKWCPKWGWRYCLSKKLAEKTPTISELLERSYPQVGHRGSLQGIEFITSTDFTHSESSKSAFKLIMEAINDKGVNMIGLHGMPGVGKTTLAKEVGKDAREQKKHDGEQNSKLFDKVVMFTMSQTPNIKNIQDKVAEVFGLKFQTNTEEGRAEELFRSMQGVNKILVIVDDLWEEIKLERIGIPFGDEHKGCKILLTTRHQQVCTKMNCQKEIQLGILSEDEAWVLFRDQAGLKDDCSTLNKEAKEVAAQCKGLPLAIVVVAKSLKGKSLSGWQTINRRFKDSRHLDNEDVLGGVRTPLKLSYDYLNNEGNNKKMVNDIQMCFLLCSLFPEDDEISIEMLITCGIGVGLFPNAYLIEDKRNEIGLALENLQKSGLLLETDDAGTIRMHDVVRDFAHWLTSTGENRFMVKDTLREWPHMVESFGCYSAIALWNCSSNIKNFQDKVEFSKLKTLFLQGEKNDLLVVSSNFFEEMKALQVLLLVHVNFSLKESASLPNLKTLWCDNCKVENLSSSLTNMRRLEILVLMDTKIDEISEELVEFSTLKYLRLSDVEVKGKKEINFPPNMLSRWTSLHELRVETENNINLSELQKLHRLTALFLRLSTNQIPREFVFPKLQRYAIVGEDYNGRWEECRTLDIQHFSSSLSTFNNLFGNVKDLKLVNVRGLKNIIPIIGEMGVNELTSLHLKSCNDMEFLIETPSHRATANLESLKKVKISYCHKLKTIFSPYLAQSMLYLEELYIERCGGLEQVIGFAQEEEITEMQNCWTRLKKLSINHCESLKYVCPNTFAEGLQSLKSVVIIHCPKLNQVFNIGLQSIQNAGTSRPAIAGYEDEAVVRIKDCKKLKTISSSSLALSMLHLRELYIFDCGDLEHVVGFTQEEEIRENDYPLSCWPKLKILTISSCESLKYVYPKGLQFLEHLHISCCSELVQVFNMEEVESSHGGVARLESLKKVEISCCHKLKTIFSTRIAQSTLNLEELYIERCGGLEQVIGFAQEEEITEMQNCWTRLKKLSIKDCESLKYVCPNTFAEGLQSLKSVVIMHCPKLIQVFNIGLQSIQNARTSRPAIADYGDEAVVEIRDCKKLKTISSSSLALSMLHLQKLCIVNCGDLEHVIGFTQEEEIRENDYPLSCWPKLKILTIRSCESLKYVYPKGHQFFKHLHISCCSELVQVFNMEEVESSHGGVARLESLKKVEISYCHKLKTMFSPYLAQSMLYLEELYIKDCGGLEQLIGFAQEEEITEMQNCWSRLKQLSIKDCESLKYVCPNTFAIGLQSLKSVVIIDCPKLIQGFNIGLQSIQNTRTSRPAIADYGDEAVVEIRDCKKLKTISSSSLALSMLHLQELCIVNCGDLEHVIGFTQEEEIRENDYPLSCWPKLKILEIRSCESLKYVYPKGLQFFKHLHISCCPELVQVFNMEKVDPSHRAIENLQSLKKVEISRCHNLKTMFSTRVARSMVNIEELYIGNCNGLEQLIGFAQEEEITENDYLLSCWPKLKILKISCCPELVQVFNMEKVEPSHRAIANLQSLKKINIISCHNLKTMFSTRVARSMVNIEELYIENCNGLEQLIGFAQEEEITENDYPLSCWPKLKILEIRYCGRLKYVYPKELQFLERLLLTDCPEFVQVFNMEEVESSHGGVARLESLKKVEISGCHNLKTMFSTRVAQSTLNIEELVIRECNGLEQLIGFSPEEEITEESLTNSTSLELRALSELRCIWNGSDHYINFHSLKTIIIGGCGKLTYLFSEFTARTLVHLEYLEIWICSSLEHLIEEAENVQETCVSKKKNHPSLCLPKLKTVEIIDCENLKYLCSSTLAQGLPYLENIKIEDCPRLIQVFNMENYKDGFGLQNHDWPKLKTLRIVRSPIFPCFIVQAQLLKGLQLESLYIEDCPQLRQVFDMEQDEYGQDILLPELIQESLTNLTSLELWSLPELRCIWNGSNHYINFHSLKTIIIEGCGKLTYLFSEFIARTLVHLESLEIRNCSSLEHLIEEAENVDETCVSNGDTGLQPISFPNLTNIHVTNCGNLKSLFPFGSAPVLPKLERLHLKKNSKLEQVFKLEDEVKVAGEVEMKFDKLKSLSLEEVPGLIHFCPKGYHFVLPALVELEVRDCPKLSTGFFIDSQQFVHCKTKTPQLVEKDAIGESTTISNAISDQNIYWSRWGFRGSQLPHVT